MASVISIATQKGGTGKSTSAINLACALADAGYRVAVVDTDPQASFTRWYRLRLKRGLKCFSVTQVPLGLMNEDVNALRESPDLDVVIVDCPGNTEAISAAAVQLSDVVISPMQPSAIDMEHLGDTGRFIHEKTKAYPDLRFLLFLNNTNKGWTLSRDFAAAARIRLAPIPSAQFLETQVSHLAAIQEFYGTGLSIFEYAPKSTAAAQYKQLTKEIVECLRKN